MDFDVNKRYQSANEFFNDVKSTVARLEAGDNESIGTRMASSQGEVVLEGQEGLNKTVMIVESKIDLQNILREKLKSRGYRVLVLSNPERALERFKADDTPPAHCVVFSAPEMGTETLEAFNRFATEEHTKDIAAILLVDRKQQHVIRNARMGANRMMLAMPLKVRELREALMKVLHSPTEPQSASDSASSLQTQE